MFELVVLAAFAALSAWVLWLFVYRAVAHDQVWIGTDGLYLEDQLMYLAWIKDASRQVLASNLFVLAPTAHDYLQPAVAVSGGLVALGVAPWAALLMWQPIAVTAVFLAVRAVVRRELSGAWSRRVAMVAALFGGAIGLRSHPDLWLPSWTWGYPFALLGLACALGCLLQYSGGGSLWIAALLAGMATWLHPWEGEVLALVLLAGEAVMRSGGARPRPRRVLAVMLAIALPLAYYGALGKWDQSWRLGQQASAGSFPLGRVALSLAPLAVPALLAYRRRPERFLGAALRAWPPAALAVFLLAERQAGNSAMHAMLGISVPLAVLAVEGIASLRTARRVPRPAVAVLALLAALAVTLPVTVSQMRYAAQFAQRSARRNPYTQGEMSALRYLARDPQPGGVLAEWGLGMLIPGEAGRHTYAGNLFWSQPDPHRRGALAWELFTGGMRPPAARAFVLASGARFLLAGCHAHADHLSRLLAPIISSQRRFGCAVVYHVA